MPIRDQCGRRHLPRKLGSRDKGDHADIWEDFKKRGESVPTDYYKATWIPSHTDLAMAKENAQRGGHEERMVVGNAHAYRDANSAMTAHEINISRHEYDGVDDRTFFACIFQHMLKTVLEKFFDEDAKLRQESGMDPEDIEALVIAEAELLKETEQGDQPMEDWHELPPELVDP